MEEENELTLEEYIQQCRPYNINFTEDISEESFLKFSKEVNDTNHILKRDLILSSFGGSARFIEPMSKIIEDGQINMFANFYICSAAFIIFFGTNTERQIMKNTVGMFHYPYINGAALTPDNKIRSESEFDKLFYEKTKKYDEKFFKELLEIDSKTHKMLKEGGELVYNESQMKKLLKKSEKMFGN